MSKDSHILIEHIWESLLDIEEYIQGMTHEEFIKDRKTQDAVARKIEIIGEAIKNLPSQFTDKYPDVEWREIAGMRDVLIHEYFGVNVEIIWDAVKHDVPILKEQILSLR